MTFTSNEKYINVLIGSYIHKRWNPSSDGYGLLTAINIETDIKLKKKLTAIYDVHIQNNMEKYDKLYNDCREQNKDTFDKHLTYAIGGIYKSFAISMYVKDYVEAVPVNNFHKNNEHLKFVNAIYSKNESLLNFIQHTFIPKYAPSIKFNFEMYISDKFFSSTPLDKTKYNRMSIDELNKTAEDLTKKNISMAMNKEIFGINIKMKDEFIDNLQAFAYIQDRLESLENVSAYQ